MRKTRNNTKFRQQQLTKNDNVIEFQEEQITTKKIKKIKKPKKQQKKYHPQQHKTCIIKEDLLEKQIQQQLVQETPIQFIQHSDNDYICPICLNYIVKAITTQCGHSFCQICLSEYFLFFQQCNQCATKIRKAKISYNVVLDSLIDSYVQRFHTEEFQEFKMRKETNKNWIQKKKPQVLQVGLKLDVLDQNYIWCSATIYRTICRWQQNRTKYIFVKYEGKQKHFNEQICQNSSRIAKNGFYTNRNDIPRYQKMKTLQLKLNQPIVFNNEQQTVFIKKIEFDFIE